MKTFCLKKTKTLNTMFAALQITEVQYLLQQNRHFLVVNEIRSSYSNNLTLITVRSHLTQTVKQFKECFPLWIQRATDLQCVTYISTDSQLPFKHLFLHQVLHPANLHLIHIVHKTGPIRTTVCTFHRLWLAGWVNGGGVIMSGGHAVAAVADAEAPESWWNAGSGESSPAALTWHRPVVSVDLSVVNRARGAA